MDILMQMTNTIRRSALLALGVFAFAGCAFETTYEGVNGFSCTSDDDCISGYLCNNIGAALGSGDGSGDVPIGRCAPEAEVRGDECGDRDSDGFFSGSECPPDRLLDCDDTDNSVNPSAREECDGLDNNCNGTIDEDQPMLPCPLQIGICSGAQRGCVDGGYVDCGLAGLYGPDYEPVETSCDDVDNDCDGEADEQCECNPRVEEATACGRDTGPCTRGVRLCQEDGSRSECISSRLERRCTDGLACSADVDCVDGSACLPRTCETSDDCGENGVCVINETLLAREDPFDDCVDDSEPECVRSVCRVPDAGSECASDDECEGESFCAEGLCRAPVIAPLDSELCNGIDDNCDGSIDNDARRIDICGPCPFNMEFTFITRPDDQPDFICVDWYEASRPDATADNVGSIELYTLPRAGVLPWTGINPDQAELICNGAPLREAVITSTVAIAPKRLCKAYEWSQGCGGTRNTAEDFDYPYSTSRDSDVFIEGACWDLSHGLTSPEPTGTAPNCARLSDDAEGTWDMSGNVAEYVVDAFDNPQLAGGSFRTLDPSILSCGDGVAYEPVPADAVERDDIGFRCCTPRQ